MNEPYIFSMSEQDLVTTEAIPPTIDPKDPFENGSEFHDYMPDYGHIVPQIRIPGCRIPRLPGQRERSRIRRYHNIVGGFLTGHFLLSNVLAVLILLVFEMLVTVVDTAASGGELPQGYDAILQSFVEDSSAMLSISVLTYGICNVLVALVGCKLTKIPLPDLFRTKGLTAPLMVGYVGVALFIQTATGNLANWMTDLFDSAGIVLFSPDLGDSTALRTTALSLVYSIVVAPITEELLMRGFVLKNLCRTNQRFGIIMSAFLFGIWHENVAQFLLAFAAGCFFGYIVVKHDSLVPAIICHMCVNCCAEVFSLMETFGLDLVGNIISVIYMLLLLVGLVMLVYMLAKERFPRTTPAQAERGVRITMTSPLMLLVIVCHVGASVLYILQASGII